MSKPPLTKEMAYELALKRGLIPPEGEISPKVALSKEKARELALKRGLIEPESSTIGQSLARGAKNTLAGALDVADLLATPIREGVNLGSKAIGSDYRMQPMAQMTSEGIDEATEGYTKAHTPTQKVEESVMRGIGSMAPGFGVGSLLAKGAGKLAQGIGGALKGANAPNVANVASTAATSGIMQHHLNENPEDVLGAAGLGILGGLGTSGIIRGIRPKTIAATAGSKLGIIPEKVEDFIEAGINPTLADVSNSKFTKGLSHIAGYTPGSTNKMHNAKELQRSQVLDALGHPEDALSKSEASALVSEGANATRKAANAKHANMFETLEKDIQRLPDRSIELNKTFQAAGDIGAHVDAKKFAKTPVGKLSNELLAKVNNGSIDYYSAKNILDDINDAVTTHGLIGKSSQGKLKHLSNALSSDIDASLGSKLEGLDPAAFQNWKEARHTYRDYATHEIPKLNELLKSDKKGATEAFYNMMTNVRRGGEKAKIALKELPLDSRNNLIESMHHRLGETKNGFSPLKWAREFKTLEPNVKSTLTSNLTKEGRHKLDAIVDTIDHLKSTIAEANTSHTAHHTAIQREMTALGAAGAAALTGHFGPAVAVIGTMAGARATAEMLTNPRLINWMYRGMKMKHLGQFEAHLSMLKSIDGVNQQMIRSATTLQKYLREERKRK